MRYSKDAGYGASVMSSLPFAGSGKIFVVGDSGTANLSMLKELFTPDVDGKVRFASTIDSAVGSCTANAGDVILVMPGHTETVTAAAGLDLDVAGITIIGLGNGANRPTINLTTATSADIDIDAANITIKNLIIDLTGIDAIATGIDVNADDFTMDSCRVLVSDSDGQATLALLTDTGVDRLTVSNCQFVGDTSAGPVGAIRIIGGEGHRIKDSFFRFNVSDTSATGMIENRTTATLGIDIANNVIDTISTDTDAKGILLMTDASGTIRYNSLRSGVDVVTTSWINTPGITSLFENYGVNNDGETGMLVGTVSTST